MAEAAIGALGLGMQFLSNQSASNNASKANKRAGHAQDRINMAFDEGMKAITSGDALGLYDPEKAAALFSKDYSTNLATTLSNMAGNSKLMGYRPGDSEPMLKMDTARARGAQDYATGVQAAKMGAISNKLNALNALNSSAQGAMAQLNTSQANLLNSQQGSYSNLLGILPSLFNLPPLMNTSKPTSTGGSFNSATPTSNSDALPVKYGGTGYFGTGW